MGCAAVSPDGTLRDWNPGASEANVVATNGSAEAKEYLRYAEKINQPGAEPAREGILAAVALPSATETDALSTALLTLGLEGHSLFADLRAGMRSLVVAEAQGQLVARAHGLALP